MTKSHHLQGNYVVFLSDAYVAGLHVHTWRAGAEQTTGNGDVINRSFHVGRRIPFAWILCQTLRNEPWPGKSPFLFWPPLSPFSCIVCSSVSWTSEVPGTDVKPTPGPARPQFKAWPCGYNIRLPFGSSFSFYVLSWAPEILIHRTPRCVVMLKGNQHSRRWQQIWDTKSCTHDLQIFANIIKNLKITTAEHWSWYGVLLSGICGQQDTVSELRCLYYLINDSRSSQEDIPPWNGCHKTKQNKTQTRAFCTYPGASTSPQSLTNLNAFVPMACAELTSSSTEKGQFQAWGVSACRCLTPNVGDKSSGEHKGALATFGRCPLVNW